MNMGEEDKITSKGLRERIATSCVCCGAQELKSSPAILMPFVSHRALGYAPVSVDNTWGLRTIPPGSAYQICKSLQCINCDHLFLDIRFSDKEMAALYHDYRGHEYTELREIYEPGYREKNSLINSGSKHIAIVEEFLAPLIADRPKILDWGGDTGINTPFKTNTKELFIYDISGKQPEDGMISVNQTSLSQHKYDLIICSHVLEHIPYPADILAEIKLAMQKNTVLYIEVPRESLIQDRAKRSDAYHVKRHWHEHINFYTDASLRCLIERCGLRLIDMKECSIKTDTNTNAIYLVACEIR